MTYKQTFRSLDRVASCTCACEEPDRYRDLLGIDGATKISVRGAGLSYVGAGFDDHGVSVSLARFDRILAFDANEKWIKVEGGVTLGKLYQFLVPQHLYVSVTPGYPAITVAGCIAANVHGKNHAREGTFGGLVESITLFHPDHGLLNLSRAENADLFELTIGGYGLTGIIVSARIRLAPLGGGTVEETAIPLFDIQDACDKVWQYGQSEDIAYAWIDLARPRSKKVRGFLKIGRMVEAGAFTEQAGAAPRLDPSAAKIRLPLLSGPFLPLINRAYYFNGVRKKKTLTPLYSALFPVIGKEFYFDWYGEQGFIEHQIILPFESRKSYFPKFDALRKKHDIPIGLTTLKASKGQGKNLHYDRDGLNFTIDIANSEPNREFLRQLDSINTDHGAITNLIKDSRVSAKVAKSQYRDYDAFRSALVNFDPKRIMQTALSKRLEL